MDLSDKLIIKVQLNDEIRKMPIHNEDITYDELIIMMERVFKHKLSQNDEITIKYKDEDGDLITISDDSDLIFAIESSKMLKLVLTVQNEETEIEKNEKQLGSMDLMTIRKELQQIRDHTNKLLDKMVHLNSDGTVNSNTSGRASATGVGDFHGVGGKEFDPLSVGNQTNFQAVERTGSSASMGSNVRQDDGGMKSNLERIKQSPSQERQFDSYETQRPSPTFSKPQPIPAPVTSGMAISQSMHATHTVPAHTQSPAMTGAFTALPPTTGQHPYPTQHNMALPPTHYAGMTLPPQSSSQSPPVGTMGAMPPTNMPGQHMGPPANLNNQHMAPFNPGQQQQQQHDGLNKMPAYPGQAMQGAPMSTARPSFYPPGAMPGQGRPNFVGPTAPGNMAAANGQQGRPNMPPPQMGPSYFTPQVGMQPGAQMYNPQQQMPPQNVAYGYQQTKQN